MSFISYDFLLFLPMVLLLYYIIPGSWQWVILLGASLVFYMSHGVAYACFLGAAWIFVYVMALVIARLYAKGEERVKENGLSGKEKRAFFVQVKKKQSMVLFLGAAFVLGILLVVKYADFAIWNYNRLARVLGSERQFEPLGWLLPLGISYYTLQALGYLIDVYRGKYRAEKNPFRLLLFLCFFPQIIQGPVGRYDKLKDTLFQSRGWEWPRISRGLERMLWGFFKKLVAADRVAPVVMAVAQNSRELDGIYVLIGMLAYTLQLYGDFTGGIDIAIGCAQIFGVELEENFKIPFASESLAEYWRRWHMSLMQWFREYVFYPLAGCKAAKAAMKTGERLIGRKAAARIPVYSASLMTWFLTGLWHGASWNFVAWGMVNCGILLASQEAAPLYRRFHKRFSFSQTRAYRRFMSVRTLLLVSAVQTFEYYPSPLTAAAMLFGMFGSFDATALFDGRASLLGISTADVVILAVCVLLFCWIGSLMEKGTAGVWMERRSWFVRFVLRLGLLLAVLVFGVYGQGYDGSQFIYNQF